MADVTHLPNKETAVFDEGHGFVSLCHIAVDGGAES